MVEQNILDKLKAEGWHLKQEALEALVQELLDDNADEPVSTSTSTSRAAGPSYPDLRAALLDCDYRKYGCGCLPDDVNRVSSSSIKGPMVLQVMSVVDVSKPSYASGSVPNRLLLLKLSDGRISCKAMEHQQCSALTDTLLPGTKVVLDQASVRLGVVQLVPRALRVLGGRVDNLAEAWEAQRRYGGTNRPGLAAASGSAAGPGAGPAAPGEAAGARLTSGAAASGAATADDGASAPKFKMFVVGKDDSKRTRAVGSQAKHPSAAAGNKAVAKPGASVAAGTSAAIAAAAVGAAVKQQEEKEVKRSVDVAPVQLVDAQTARQQSAAQAKLLDKLERSQAEAAEGRGRGRGGFRGRRGRRGRNDSDDEAGGGGGMTLEEYEAKQKSGKVTLNLGATSAASGRAARADDEQMRRDEELARQLQAQLDLEEASMYQPQQQGQNGHRHMRQQQLQRGWGHDGPAGTGQGRDGNGGQLHLQYEQYSQQQQHRRDSHSGYRAAGEDYTEAMFDNFDYNAGRGARAGGGIRGAYNSRGGHRGGDGRQGFGRSSGGAGGTGSASSSRGSGVATGWGRATGRGRGR